MDAVSSGFSVKRPSDIVAVATLTSEMKGGSDACFKLVFVFENGSTGTILDPVSMGVSDTILVVFVI